MGLRVARRAIEAEVSRLIALLDAMDGDPDMEPEPLEASEEDTGGEDERQDMEPHADFGDTFDWYAGEAA